MTSVKLALPTSSTILGVNDEYEKQAYDTGRTLFYGLEGDAPGLCPLFHYASRFVLVFIHDDDHLKRRQLGRKFE